MGMTRISFDVPEDVLLSLNESEQDFAREARVLTAISLYHRGKLSMGKAAELASMEKTQFLFELDKYAVPAIDYDAEDFRREIDRSNA